MFCRPFVVFVAQRFLPTDRSVIQMFAVVSVVAALIVSVFLGDGFVFSSVRVCCWVDQWFGILYVVFCVFSDIR